MAAKCASQELLTTDSIRVFPGAVSTRLVNKVMESNTETAKTFAAMLERAEFAEPNEVARFISSLLLDAPDDLLQTRQNNYNVRSLTLNISTPK